MPNKDNRPTPQDKLDAALAKRVLDRNEPTLSREEVLAKYGFSINKVKSREAKP